MTSKEALSIIKHIDIDGRYPYPNFLKDDERYKESIEVLEKLVEENEMLKAQNYIYNLENIQLKQDNSLILDNQEQSKALFNYIAEVYEELDSLMARLQDDYNNGIEFEQREEDRLIIGNILDIFTDLENALPLKEELKNF